MKMFFVICLIIINFFSAQNNTCVSNLECTTTACCKEGICVEHDECRKDIRNVYIAVGMVGLGFIIIISIYFVWSIRETRKNVRMLRDSENANKVK
jgi:hypothetical protein